MKNSFLVFFLLCSLLCFSQISVSNNHHKKTKEFDKEIFNRFTKTKTIFVLPTVIDTKNYDAILKEYWKITPYKIVDFKDFNFKDYEGKNYSFVYLHTSVKTIDKSRAINVYIHATLDVFMLDETLKEKYKENWFENKIDIASILLFPKNEVLKTLANVRDNHKKLKKITYEKDVFYNFNLGFFKNYVQKAHQQLTQQLTEEKASYYLYKSDFLPEIKNLSETTLYVPEYTGLKFNGFRETNTGKHIENIKKLFDSYNFKYTIIKKEELSKLIMADSNFYYAKYTRINTQRFLHIINAKTGEIVYRKYMAGIAYNLNTKHIANLNGVIKKAQL